MWRGANQLDSHFQGICLLIGGVSLNIRHSTEHFICMFSLILTGRWSICYSFQARKLKLKGSSNLCKVSKLEDSGEDSGFEFKSGSLQSLCVLFLRPWKRQIKCWCFPQRSDLKGLSCQLVQETNAKSLLSLGAPFFAWELPWAGPLWLRLASFSLPFLPEKKTSKIAAGP